MKKTKLVKLLVIFCIMLSFFNSIYAASTNLVDVGDANIVSVTEDGYTTHITANNTAGGDNKNGKFTFTSKHTGLVTIDVTGTMLYEEKDLCYIITDSSGKQIRLAAYKDDSGGYKTYTDIADNKSTQIDIIVTEGEEYTIELSSNKITPTSVPGSTYFPKDEDSVANQIEYNISIKWNEEVNGSEKFYQSDIAASKVTNSVLYTSESLLETEDSNYAIPDGTDTELTDSDGNDAVKALEEYIVNPFEETICELMLAVGDFFINLMNSIIGQEVTITALVYNQVDAVNPNFFDKTVTGSGATAEIKTVVSKWYEVFMMLAIAIYIVTLLAIGLQILLASTGDGMSKGKTLIMSWLKGIICLAFIPYLIKYAFLLNEGIVDMLRQAGDVPDYKVGNTFGHTDEWSAEEIEFRSPEFVSNYTGSVAFGSDEATESYIGKVTNYEQNLDLMRIMRAYAGVTKKFIYAVIWWILIGQLIAFIVQYYKRYFMIAFLIAMFPLICIFNAISIARGGEPKEVSSWMKELFTNIFTQMVHAIIYTIITGVCVSIVKQDIQSSATLNWLIIILAINFVSEGEKLLRKLIGAMGSTAHGVGQTGQGIKGAYNKVKSNVKEIFKG